MASQRPPWARASDRDNPCPSHFPALTATMLRLLVASARLVRCRHLNLNPPRSQRVSSASRRCLAEDAQRHPSVVYSHRLISWKAERREENWDFRHEAASQFFCPSYIYTLKFCWNPILVEDRKKRRKMVCPNKLATLGCIRVTEEERRHQKRPFRHEVFIASCSFLTAFSNPKAFLRSAPYLPSILSSAISSRMS